MVRVLQAMAGARHGGAEAFFTRLVAALHRAGLEQRAVFRGDPQRVATLRAAGVEVVEVRFGGPLDLSSGPGLRRAIEAFEPDVVLTWMNRATRTCPPGRFVHAARLGGYYKLKHYRRCHHLVANTRDIVRYLVDSGWPAERAHYLPNFVEAAPAPPLDRGALETPAGTPLVLALGRLHPNKAFDVLIEALAAVADTYLWIGGAGPLGADLEAHAVRRGVGARVRFLGWRDDVAALMAAADVFVCPSRHEPLGNVVIEAWAHGVPVVAAAGAGPVELIADGETGLLVPVDDADALAGAIRRVLADSALAGRLAAAGRAAFEQSHSERVVVGRYLDFFARVAA